jgi:formyltetrahydrofolate deformylase
LIDLLYRVSVGTLPIEVPVVVSNHPTFAKLCASYDVPFVHLPLDASNTKEEQERRLLELCDEHKIDLVVLARYMQILSPALCAKMEGRIINSSSICFLSRLSCVDAHDLTVHHSFLPSFKGAKPYHQAHARGVKLIGATAHLVTSDLDEGPLIAQDVVRVTHAHSPAQMVALGAEVEERVLASAVQWTAERRVILNGTKVR